MANLKDIKSRIQSVENTKKITRAMKMVAAAKIKKAESAVKNARPFAEELIRIFKKLLASVEGGATEGVVNTSRAIENYPEFLKPREVKTIGLLVITSNKGLAGAYNANIIRGAVKAIKDNQEKGLHTKLFIIGLKGITSLKRKIEGLDAEIVKTYSTVMAEVNSTGAELVAEDLAKSYIAKEIDKIEVYTTKFKNMMSYLAQKWDLVPVSIEKEEETTSTEIDPVMMFEPSKESILQKVMPLYLTNTIYQALLEAQASELAARMTAMSAASNNAEEMIRTLTIDYNKARQWAITQEIIEVASGADAIKN